MNPLMQPGVWGILATPFSGSTLDVDDTGVARLVEHAEASGVAGLTVLGVFGEAAKLSWEERRLVLETVLDTTDLPVVVGCTSLATAPAIDEVEMAVELAGDRLAGVMLQVNSSVPNLLDAHLRAVHQATGADVVVQDYPLVSGVSIPATALANVVARSPHVTAVKAEAPPTPVAVAELTRRCSVPVFGGLGGVNLVDELACGAAGAMTGFSYPEALVTTVRAFEEEGIDRAREVFAPWLPLANFEAQAGISLALRKEILRSRALMKEGSVRAPALGFPDVLRNVLGSHVADADRRLALSMAGA
jgi:4-hydroxy-tetrahydrodipicolinate synthase